MAFVNPIDLVREAKRAELEQTAKLASAPKRALNAVGDVAQAGLNKVASTIRTAGQLPYDPTMKLPPMEAPAAAPEAAPAGAQPGAAEYATSSESLTAGPVAKPQGVGTPPGQVSQLTPKPAPVQTNSYLPPGVQEMTAKNMRGGFSGPSSAGTPAAESPIIKQYNTLQAQKARDLDLERQRLTNYLLQSATMTSPYDTVARARINAGQGRLGASLARAPQATIAATTAENVAGKQAEATKGEALTRLEGTKLSAEASKYGSEKGAESAKYTADTSAEARRYGSDADVIARTIAAQATQKAAETAAGGRVEAAKAGRSPKVVTNPNDPQGGAYRTNADGTTEYVTPESLRAQQELKGVQDAFAQSGGVPGVPFTYKGQQIMLDPKTNQFVPYKAK